ncbi:MAG: tRNA pseudouridine(55) synthase TruB [Sorangium cellulosum]|nr:MAG: tRNA pseudouridine(55) synthase TruB [Sorangium cellulosum]
MTSSPSGLLIIDKPRGPTSHDVVVRIRRTLNTRSVGHAGTLDPMATGVLVVMVGACTKLSRFLVLEEKKYRATVGLGTATDTLDAEGQVTREAPIPQALIEALEQGKTSALLTRLLEVERARMKQIPPNHSAIKTQGVASYKRARRGETLQLPARFVKVHALTIEATRLTPPELDFELHVSKGYYVRSLARDVGKELGVPAHLTSLRRIQSGVWGLKDAVSLDANAETMVASMIALEKVAGDLLASVQLTETGKRKALFGQPMTDEDFESPPGQEPTAWFGPNGKLIAVGDRSRDRPTVLRAFLHAEQMC